ncbi:MAG: type II restriction endonuclease [candidate division WOR-3 bacterium]|nr:type II restriction endonuclease [candidate division WOR-3 bacterium]
MLNLKYDIEFRKTYLKMIKSDLDFKEFIGNIEKYDKRYLIAIFKCAISKYIDKLVKNFSILEERITTSEFGDFSIRFSNYLLNNLKLNETLAGVNIEKYLKYKRIPVDTKGLHGNYPKIRILKILESNGYTNIDNILNDNGIQTLKHDLQKQIKPLVVKNKKIFCTERFIDEIIKTKDNKPKKFDLIIFSKCKPKYLFEMNFYSTEGTKIGINQNEYIDLNNYIRRNFKEFEFYWITDGNYWLTTQGKSRFENLLKYFKQILNINTFAENLNNFK